MDDDDDWPWAEGWEDLEDWERADRVSTRARLRWEKVLLLRLELGTRALPCPRCAAMGQDHSFAWCGPATREHSDSGALSYGRELACPNCGLRLSLTPSDGTPTNAAEYDEE